jgi:hypothetical protein
MRSLPFSAFYLHLYNVTPLLSVSGASLLNEFESLFADII